MQKQVEKIILKHYANGNCEWEKCGREIESLIDKEANKIKNKNYPYMQECNKIDKVRRNIEGIYYSFFEVGRNAYDYINGNSNLKELLNTK
jgi:hypothetical protein